MPSSAAAATIRLCSSHEYADEGTYSITVTINDEGGSTTTDTGTASVAEAQLTSPHGASLTETAELAFGPVTVATFVDPGNPTITPDSDYTGTIAWGDSQTTNLTTANFVNMGGAGTDVWTVLGSHTYASGGSYSILVSITDGVYNGNPNTVVADGTATVANTGTIPTTTTVADAGGIYDGMAYPATSSVTGVGLNTTATSLDYYDTDTNTDLGSNAPINAGHYTVTATYAGNVNYSPSAATRCRSRSPRPRRP